MADFIDWAFVSLGSNLGSSQEVLQKAISHLAKLSNQSLLASSIWRTTPVDCPPGSPEFFNAVVGLVPPRGSTPEKFLEQLHAIEWAFGRRERLRLNEPRVLDLDLISYGSERRQTDQLTLPHQRAHLRKFVLIPLAEVAPDLVLPGQTETVVNLLQQLHTDELVVKVDS